MELKPNQMDFEMTNKYKVKAEVNKNVDMVDRCVALAPSISPVSRPRTKLPSASTRLRAVSPLPLMLQPSALSISAIDDSLTPSRPVTPPFPYVTPAPFTLPAPRSTPPHLRKPTLGLATFNLNNPKLPTLTHFHFFFNLEEEIRKKIW